MCDVPSTAVFCSESIECFSRVASKFFLKFLVTIPVAPIITGIIIIIIIIIIAINCGEEEEEEEEEEENQKQLRAI